MHKVEPGHSVSRRGLLVVGTAGGLATLAACGGDSEPSGAGAEPSSPAAGSPDAGSTGEDDSSAGETGQVVAQVSEIPVGGAVSVTASGDRALIVSQPSKGQIVALSAICTHRGCTVEPDGGTLRCPCHGSTYDLTGQNTGGPAPRPLEEIQVRLEQGDVVVS